MFGSGKAQKTIRLNMKKIQLIILSIITTCALSSCYYDNFKELHPDAALPTTSTDICDSSAAISYSAQILPILNASCTQNCHNNVGGGHDLSYHASVQADAVGGTLVPSVDGTGGNPMPQGSAPLSACDVAKIRKWVNAGAPNN